MTSLTGQRRNKAKWLTLSFNLAAILVFLGIVANALSVFFPRCLTAGALKKAATFQVSTFATALDMFRADNGHYPASLNELVAQPMGATNWHQYMESIPLDPWAHPYVYTFPGKHRTNLYDLMSMGLDGRVGGGDDIVNCKTTN